MSEGPNCREKGQNDEDADERLIGGEGVSSLEESFKVVSPQRKFRQGRECFALAEYAQSAERKPNGGLLKRLVELGQNDR